MIFKNNVLEQTTFLGNPRIYNSRTREELVIPSDKPGTPSPSFLVFAIEMKFVLQVI